MKTFYMIYVEGKSSPTMKHDTFEAAEAEAQRLSMATHSTAYVLKCTSAFGYLPQRIEVSE